MRIEQSISTHALDPYSLEEGRREKLKTQAVMARKATEKTTQRKQTNYIVEMGEQKATLSQTIHWSYVGLVVLGASSLKLSSLRVAAVRVRKKNEGFIGWATSTRSP
ncbi:hypothetical protein Ddc_06834 [Ditylenchus destructor]|nr:hypothetical protein Ddc_06834 [Ditylenchus destructor]